MKTKMILIVSILMASANANAELSKREVKLQARYINRVLKCARKAIDQKRGGLEAVKFAATYLNDAQVKKDDIKALKDLYKTCNKERKEMEKQKDVTWGEFHSEVENTIEEGTPVQNILRSFTHPYIKCSLAGANLNIGVGLVIGAGLKVASCKATNGKRFYGIAPEGELGIGGGFNALVGSNQFSYYLHDDYYRDSNIQSYDDDLYLTVGLGLSMGGALAGGNGEDVGVGVGLMFTGRSGTNFKFIPRTNDFSSLRRQLLQ